jgi:transposase
MAGMTIFLGQFALALVLYGLLARYLFWPYARSLPLDRSNALLLTPHALRLLGLLAIVPEVVGEPLTRTAFAAEVALSPRAYALA